MNIPVALSVALFWFSIPQSYAGFTLTAWTCKIPCVDPDDESRSLQPVHFAYCSAIAPNTTLMQKASELCTKADKLHHAQAAMRLHDGIHAAECITGGEACDTDGPIKSKFACSALCPGERVPVKFAACAFDTKEAWALADSVCKGARKPSAMPLNRVCEGAGPTPCTD